MRRRGKQRDHHNEIILGARLRKRRKALKMPLRVLGEHVGLTHQQIQKYEKGVNRIPATRLWELSKLLDVPMDYFFKDFD